MPNQIARDRAVSMKLNIIGELVKGRRIVVVDDSVVRGTTTRSKMLALRNAGAKEIHLRVSCPPIRHPCFYGIDFATTDELVANNRTVDQIRDFIEVDSLFVSSSLAWHARLPEIPQERLLHRLLERGI